MEGSIFQLVSGTTAVSPGAETSRPAELKGDRTGSKNPAREGSGVMVRLYNTIYMCNLEKWYRWTYLTLSHLKKSVLFRVFCVPSLTPSYSHQTHCFFSSIFFKNICSHASVLNIFNSVSLNCLDVCFPSSQHCDFSQCGLLESQLLLFTQPHLVNYSYGGCLL